MPKDNAILKQQEKKMNNKAAANKSKQVSKSAAKSSAANPAQGAYDTIIPSIQQASIVKALDISLANSNEVLAQTATKQKAIQNKIENNTDKGKNAILAVAESDQIISKQKAIATKNVEEFIQESFKSLGGRKEFEQLLSAQKAAIDERDALQAELDKLYNREVTGLSVVDGLFNGIQAGQLEQKLFVANRKVNQAVTAVNAFGAATEQANTVAQRTKQSVTEATIAAEQKKIADLANKMAADAELKSLELGAVQLDRVMRANVQQTNYLLEQEKRFERAEDRMQRRNEYKLRVEEYNLRLQAMQDAMMDKLEKERLLTLKVRTIQKGQAILRTKVDDESTLRSRITEDPNYRLNDRYNTFFEVGASYIQGGEPVIAANPSEAYIRIQEFTPAGEEPSGVKQVLDKLRVAYDKSFAASKTKNRPKTTADMKASFNSFVDSELERQAAEIVPGDVNNVYSGANLSVLADDEIGSVAIKSSPLYQSVLKDLGRNELNPQRLLEDAVSGVRSRVITPEQAAQGLSTIFTVAINHNNAYKNFSMAQLKPQTSYNVRVKIPGATDLLPGGSIFGSMSAPEVAASITDKVFGTSLSREDTIVDMSDYNQVAYLVNRYLASGNIEAMFGSANPYKEDVIDKNAIE